MRTLKILVLAVIFTVGMSTAHAADDFGSPFTNEEPSAFADPVDMNKDYDALAMDEAMNALNDIMPAAGDEAQAEPLIIDQMMSEDEEEALEVNIVDMPE
ncbi:MAG: hypothetical protein KTR28_06290 [Micavibrio sp.]|nr:hypothetical protein [Micavibrio sp.]